MSSTASILACPAELIDKIITPLRLKDLQSFRASSRALQAKSLDHYRKSYFKRRVVDITPDGISNLVAVANNPHLSCELHTLTVRFEDHVMRAACTMKYLHFTRLAFVNKEERKATDVLLQMHVFETPYFQNAVRSHSPGDLIWSMKNYRVGEIITADMADRLNRWITFMTKKAWVEPLREVMTKLPHLKAASLCDRRDRQQTLHPSYYAPYQQYPHPANSLSALLSSCANRVDDIRLDFQLCLETGFQKVLRALHVSSPHLQNLSMAVDKQTKWYTPEPVRIDSGTKFRHLRQLHLQRISERSLMATAFFEAIREGTFPALETLSLENMTWPYEKFMSEMQALKVSTLKLNRIYLDANRTRLTSWNPDGFIGELFENKFLRAIHVDDVVGFFEGGGYKVFLAPEDVAEK